MKYVLVLGVGALLLIGLAGFYLFGGTDEISSDGMVTKSEVVADTPESENTLAMSGRASVAQLLAAEVNLECTITYDVLNEGEVDGTMFLADGKVRTDFLLTNPEFGQYAASVIILPEYLYSWSQIEGSTYGVRISTSELQSTEGSADSSVPITLGDQVRYSCKDWENVDQTVFTPPTTVLFKDAAAIDAEYGTVYKEGDVVY